MSLLAPLPKLYRIVLFAVVTVLGFVAARWRIGAGVWLAQAWELPAGGILVGTLSGLVVAYLLLHDFHAAPRAARVTRRR